MARILVVDDDRDLGELLRFALGRGGHDTIIAHDVAQGIAALANGTADQSYTSFVAQVGSDVQSNTSALTTAKSLLSSINNQRQSVSGVSLDEEMTNLVSYQRAYQASARMMTTIDSALDTLINHTGTVGL